MSDAAEKLSAAPGASGRPRDGAITGAVPDPRRWLILATVGMAQLMVVLDVTIVNIALPSAQKALHFSAVDRQWVITACALAFGSLLLLFGRVADIIGRKTTFLIGLSGFALASAAGGAATSFDALVAARACQGVFGAFLAPSALSLLSTTFTDPGERGKAFGIYGGIAGGGGAAGVLLGGILTQYLSWRWCLYVNVVFAVVAIGAGALLLRRQRRQRGSRLDLAGMVLGSGAMFCLVFGFSNAAMHSWHTPSTWGFLAASGALLIVFAAWQARASSPLLPPRIAVDRNRGGAYLGVLIMSAGMFGVFLFLTFYLQETLGYSAVVTGLAFLPMIAFIGIAANVSNIVLMPRVGPKPIVGAGMLLAAAGMAWLTRIGVHSSYVSAVLGPEIVTGAGMGMVISSSFNTGTFGVAESDAGVASATLNTGQQIGGSIGTALLNTVAASATAHYVSTHIGPRTMLGGRPSPALAAQGMVHGYTTGFWWSAAIFAVGAVVCGILFRPGPLTPGRGRTTPEPAGALK